MDFKEIERKLLTSYRKEIYRPFVKGVADYDLINENDHICVCISGGKDSLTLAKCMQELERHGKVKFKCEFVLMNPGFPDESLISIKNNAEKMGIPLEIYNSNIFESVKNSGHKSPCYICSKMRRGNLYDYAKQKGCNKIALGHHFDDVISTTMMSLLYNGIFNTMLPKLKSDNFEDMFLIRPLYLVRENDIERFMKSINIIPTPCKCPLKNNESKRSEVKQILEDLQKSNKFVHYNIFKASENVELDRIRGVKKNNKRIDLNDFTNKFQ